MAVPEKAKKPAPFSQGCAQCAFPVSAVSQAALDAAMSDHLAFKHSGAGIAT